MLALIAAPLIHRAPFDILHFSGHGSVADNGTMLMLEDDHDLGAARPLGGR